MPSYSHITLFTSVLIYMMMIYIYEDPIVVREDVRMWTLE